MRILALILPLAIGCAHVAPTSERPPLPSIGGASMVLLSPDVLVDPAATPAEREGLRSCPIEARREVETILGPLQSEMPLTIFCKTEACELFIAGSARRSAVLAPGNRPAGATYSAARRSIAILRVDSSAKRIAEHELTHVEMFHRLHGSFLPAWFHEGLAAFVSHEPDCTHVLVRGIDDLRRLDHARAWLDYTNNRGALTPTYCQAEREVAEWVAHNGHERLMAMLDTVIDGATFYEIYGPLLTGSGGRTDVLATTSTELGDSRKPFSIAMWIKPTSDAGVLAHLSDNGVGTGWCTPFIGFDAAHHLISQIPIRRGPEVANYSIAVDPGPVPLGKWTHVAMTWAPGGSNRLYVDGALAAETAAHDFFSAGAGAMMSVTWGSYNLGGIDMCWLGAIAGENFTGAIAGTKVVDKELTPAEIDVLAKSHP